MSYFDPVLAKKCISLDRRCYVTGRVVGGILALYPHSRCNISILTGEQVHTGKKSWLKLSEPERFVFYINFP